MWSTNLIRDPAGLIDWNLMITAIMRACWMVSANDFMSRLALFKGGWVFIISWVSRCLIFFFFWMKSYFHLSNFCHMTLYLLRSDNFQLILNDYYCIIYYIYMYHNFSLNYEKWSSHINKKVCMYTKYSENPPLKIYF